MAHNEDNVPDAVSKDATRDSTLSRRQVLTGAGLVAAGAGLPAALAGAAGTDAVPAGRMVGVAPQGGTAVEFRARFAQTGQTGEHFEAYGYLTAASGATDDELFAGPQQNDTTALLTAYAVGNLVRRTTDQAVHSLDIEGTFTVYQRPGPGASFADPSSFQVGTPVATFAMVLQDIVTVIAPGKGIPTLNGDMRQTLADQLSGGGRFGHVGARARMFATGLGTLVDPVRLNSVLEMAGNWTAK
jgi:hypothetical protein